MPTKTKITTMFNGVVLEEIMALEPEIVWCWQKVMTKDYDRVVRVTACHDDTITVFEDRVGKTEFSAIYLDDDCIAAINHARSLTNEV